METTTQKFWGVQVTTESGENALSFKDKKGHLYFSVGKGGGRYKLTPPPELFLTKKDATRALDKSSKLITPQSKLKKMFENVIYGTTAKVVPIILSVN